MKFIYFNPETRIGYITDPLTPEDGEFIAKGIGLFMAVNIVAAIITALVVLPFFIVSGLDKFIISFYTVNKNFIIGSAIVLILIKFFTVRLSSALFIRFIFSLLIMVPILYILLYKFHMADITIFIGKRLELTNTFFKDTNTNTVWFQPILHNIGSVTAKAFNGVVDATKTIDYTAFSTSLSTINIISVLVCIGKTIFWWGLLIILSLAILILGIGFMVIVIGLPYFIAYGSLVLVNNLIYKIKCSYVKYLKF